jgi:hypothetical protein
MRAGREARSDDFYFVWQMVAMLAAFGVGLTHPHGMRFSSPAANPPVMDEAMPREFVSAPTPGVSALTVPGQRVAGVEPSLPRIVLVRASVSDY